MAGLTGFTQTRNDKSGQFEYISISELYIDTAGWASLKGIQSHVHNGTGADGTVYNNDSYQAASQYTAAVIPDSSYDKTKFSFWTTGGSPVPIPEADLGADFKMLTLTLTREMQKFSPGTMGGNGTWEDVTRPGQTETTYVRIAGGKLYYVYASISPDKSVTLYDSPADARSIYTKK